MYVYTHMYICIYVFIGWSNNHVNDLRFRVSLETSSIQTMQLKHD